MPMFRIALLCAGLAACSPYPEPDRTQRYQLWLRAGHAEEVAAYATYLARQRLDHVVPMQDLLRSGRRWRGCGVDEFSVPPRENWSAIVPTLRLVADLRAARVLGEAEVASAWRSREFNICEGGSPESRHVGNNALDFDIASGAGADALCDHWRRHGAAKRFGLGFYSPGKIHVDTSGFRTWGRDHRRGTSLCERNAARK